MSWNGMLILPPLVVGCFERSGECPAGSERTASGSAPAVRWIAGVGGRGFGGGRLGGRMTRLTITTTARRTRDAFTGRPPSAPRGVRRRASFSTRGGTQRCCGAASCGAGFGSGGGRAGEGDHAVRHVHHSAVRPRRGLCLRVPGVGFPARAFFGRRWRRRGRVGCQCRLGRRGRPRRGRAAEHGRALGAAPAQARAEGARRGGGAAGRAARARLGSGRSGPGRRGDRLGPCARSARLGGVGRRADDRGRPSGGLFPGGPRGALPRDGARHGRAARRAAGVGGGAPRARRNVRPGCVRPRARARAERIAQRPRVGRHRRRPVGAPRRIPSTRTPFGGARP